MESVPEIRDSDDVRAAIADTAEARRPGVAEDGLPERIGTIEFRGVGFAYDGGRSPAARGRLPLARVALAADQVRDRAAGDAPLHRLDRRQYPLRRSLREAGNRLSTGQEQLVAFARAVIGGPEILVMDVATSSIDTETEQRIQAALHRVLAGRTCFVIAHRLSTIRAADRILVIDGGRIVEAGDHARLMNLRGRYAELYREQCLRWTGRSAAAWSG